MTELKWENRTWGWNATLDNGEFYGISGPNMGEYFANKYDKDSSSLNQWKGRSIDECKALCQYDADFGINPPSYDNIQDEINQAQIRVGKKRRARKILEHWNTQMGGASRLQIELTRDQLDGILLLIKQREN